ncbi:DUF1850 domain-containing protein [Salinisphaera sp. USBA-960]|nr:DUF1850 domain-containing protein [Salifodinibacter halophilus]NNC26281.1 DUF1850 domain-containing protein [Salifodinibacter halophilus]
MSRLKWRGGWRRLGYAAAAVAILVAALWLSWPRPWLAIHHGTHTVAVYPGPDGTEFALRWMHSVEREDWIECFRLHDAHIKIVATRFKTFGAGVPAHAGQHTHLENGWVVMSDIDRKTDPLTIQAAAAEHYRFRYEHGAWQRLSHPHQAPILTFKVIYKPLLFVLPARLTTLWHGIAAING